MEDEKEKIAYETKCGVTLPAVEIDKVYEVMIYRVGRDWEEFLRNTHSHEIKDVTDEDFLKKIARATNTMYSRNGIGIAANQVGFKENWFILDTQWHETGVMEPRVVINPLIKTVLEESTYQEEGCLSVPLGFRGNVKRSSAITITYTDLNGNEVEWLALDLDARAVQHEMGHLYGKLFIDYVSNLRRSFLEKKIEKAKKIARNTIKTHNKNIVKQVKDLNIKYAWSNQYKKDLAEKQQADKPLVVEQPNEQVSDF